MVIHSWSRDICMWTYGRTYDRWVYEWTTVGRILPRACLKAQCIRRTDIRISGGRTEPSMFQSDYLWSAATCIENAAVPLDGGWISYDCTMSVRQLQVKITLYLKDQIMPPDEGRLFCNCTMGVRQLQFESTLELWMFWMGIIYCYRYIHQISAWTLAQWSMVFLWSYATISTGVMAQWS